MAITQKTVWKCDLCKWTWTETQTQEPPAGWVKIGLEDYHVDRSFYDVCPDSNEWAEVRGFTYGGKKAVVRLYTDTDDEEPAIIEDQGEYVWRGTSNE